jgi:hypothetical protein
VAVSLDRENSRHAGAREEGKSGEQCISGEQRRWNYAFGSKSILSFVEIGIVVVEAVLNVKVSGENVRVERTGCGGWSGRAVPHLLHPIRQSGPFLNGGPYVRAIVQSPHLNIIHEWPHHLAMARHKLIFEHASVAKLARPDARLPTKPRHHNPKKKIELADKFRTTLRSKSGTSAH